MNQFGQYNESVGKLEEETREETRKEARDEEADKQLSLKLREFSRIHFEFFENFTSPHTKINYQNDLRQFFNYLKNDLGQTIQSLDQVQRAHIIAFRKYLEQRGGKDGGPAAPKTIIRKLSGLSRYWKHLMEMGIVTFNICDGVKRPRTSLKQETLDFSNEEAKRIQEEAGKGELSGPLHRAVLAVLFGTGMRKSELISLKRSSYQEEKGHKILQFKVKGNRWHKVPLNPATIRHLENYLDWMKSKGEEIDPQESLFRPMRNNTGKGGTHKPLSATAVDYIVKKNVKKLGLDPRLGPHSIRATVIGHLIEEGKFSLDEIARFVNHRSVDTTRSYDKRKKNLDHSPAYGNKLVS